MFIMCMYYSLKSAFPPLLPAQAIWGISQLLGVWLQLLYRSALSPGSTDFVRDKPRKIGGSGSDCTGARNDDF